MNFNTRIALCENGSVEYNHRPELGNDPKYSRHGGAYDRGACDAYYWRTPSPHYYMGDTKMSEMVVDLTQDELDAYLTGFYETDDRKDWG